MAIDRDGLQHMIRCLIRDGESHREAVFREINRTFLDAALAFFREVVEAKLRGEDLGEDDWYRSELIERPGLPKEAVAMHAGMPNKTVQNTYGTTRREVVLDVGLKNYESLQRTINELVAQRDSPSIVLTIKLGAVGVDLTLNESLIVINSLAIQRERIRGGKWSSAGKQLERPLMATLCLLYGVDRQHWRIAGPRDAKYQVDFVLRSGGRDYPCEVKLMGPGNRRARKPSTRRSRACWSLTTCPPKPSSRSIRRESNGCGSPSPTATSASAASSTASISRMPNPPTSTSWMTSSPAPSKRSPHRP